MPHYSSSEKVIHGMPVGSLGSGKMEINSQGLINAITIQNNWSRPIAGDSVYPGVLGYHFGFYYNDGRSKKAVLLQTVPVLDIPLIDKIDSVGNFPESTLRYQLANVPVEISLRFFSPWVPGNAQSSSLPTAFFEFSVKNLSAKKVEVGLLFIGRNTVGDWCVGRKNTVSQTTSALNVHFSNQDPSPERDPLNGEIIWSFEKKGWSLSFEECWNSVTKNFSYNAQNIRLDAWDFFAKNGSLTNTPNSPVAPGENREYCSAVSAKATLKPGESKALPFSASWRFGNHAFGHRYEKDFKSATQISEASTKNRAVLDQKQRRFSELVKSLPFPDWFCDALLTNLAPFVASSWYTRDRRFAFYEAPQVCPLLGTLDVGFYGSIPLSYFFPELASSQTTQFAKAQQKDGYVPHDLGRNRLDCPSNGTTFYFWKDLNPKFVLMAYRDTLWSGDERFLKFVYPHAKKALEWSLAQDHDGNLLPDHEGQDQTFDLWDMKGTNAYTGGIFLAALLAGEKMALLRRDGTAAKKFRSTFEQAKKNFETELWNGKYFGSVCSLSQLNGQWYSRLLGLEPIAQTAKILKALETIGVLNAKSSRVGLINAALPDGRPDQSNDHARNVWPGMNYAYIALALAEGLPLKNLLKPAKGIWDNVTSKQKSPWNQADTMDAKTGAYVFGDFYYRNMAIWSIPILLAQKDRKTAGILHSLKRL